MNIKSNLKRVVLLSGLVLTSNATAGAVTTGEFVLDFDEASLGNLGAQVVNVNWFDSVASADKTPQEMRETPAADSVPDSFAFKVFGASIPTPPVGLQERAPQVSTFKYEGDPTMGAGIIGLSGFHVISTLAGGMSIGDYGLSYDASRIGNAANSSGWLITNYHAFSLKSFDLTNVEMTIIDNENFSMTGDVVIADGLALMLSAEEGTDVGDFSFTTVVGADPVLDGSIANYSYTTNILTLPVLMSNGRTYAASFEANVLEGNKVALDLKNISSSSVMAVKHAMFDKETGIITMPLIMMLDNTGTRGNKVTATMKLEDGYFPARFILKTIDVITE